MKNFYDLGEKINNLFNTYINVIGSIPDYEMIFKSFHLFNIDDKAIENSILKNNEFNFRTENSRKRFISAMKSVFFVFKNEQQKTLLLSIFKDSLSLETKQLFLFWLFVVNNKLFNLITINVFFPNYYSGRISLPRTEIIAYLKELLAKEQNINWGTSTIEMIASKYLSILKKINILNGSKKKLFKIINLRNTDFILFIYFLKFTYPQKINILDNPLVAVSFLSIDSFKDRLKSIALKGDIEMSYNGEILKVDLNYNCEEIINVIQNRK